MMPFKENDTRNCKYSAFCKGGNWNTKRCHRFGPPCRCAALYRKRWQWGWRAAVCKTAELIATNDLWKIDGTNQTLKNIISFYWNSTASRKKWHFQCIRQLNYVTVYWQEKKSDNCSCQSCAVGNEDGFGLLCDTTRLTKVLLAHSGLRVLSNFFGIMTFGYFLPYCATYWTRDVRTRRNRTVAGDSFLLLFSVATFKWHKLW